MAILVTSDIHLTSDPNHEYRWKLFDCIKQQVVDSEPPIKELVICGDLTEKKGGHSAALVNRIVHEFNGLTDLVRRVHIVPGNHDHEPGEQSFFEFLRYVSEPSIRFHADVDLFQAKDTPSMLFVPNGMLDKALERRGYNGKADVAFLHEGFNGVTLANGTKLQHGVDAPPALKDLAYRIYSGDIHTPQKFRGVTYVGTPYPIDFDENHACRMIVFDYVGATEKRKETSVPVQIIRKHTLRVRNMGMLEQMLLEDVGPGDQVKVVWHLSERDFGNTSSLYNSINSRVRSEKAFLTGGVQFVVQAGRSIASMDCKDLTAVNSVHDVLTHYIKLKKIRPPLARVGRKIVKRHK